MELTPDQCAVIAATIPVFLLTYAIEHRILIRNDGATPFRLLWTVIVVVLGLGEMFAFEGIAHGLTGPSVFLASGPFFVGVGATVGVLLRRVWTPPQAAAHQKPTHDPDDESDQVADSE